MNTTNEIGPNHAQAAIVRFLYSHEPLGSDTKEPFRATAPFRSRFAEAGVEVCRVSFAMLRDTRLKRGC